MTQNLTLISQYHNESFSFSFDKEGHCLTNDRIQKIINFTVFESSGYVSIYLDFIDALIGAIKLLKSGKEISVTIGVTVQIDHREALLHLCKMSVDLPKEELRLDNHNVHAVCDFSGKMLSVDNQKTIPKSLSDLVKSIKNNHSIEKELKIEYFTFILWKPNVSVSKMLCVILKI